MSEEIKEIEIEGINVSNFLPVYKTLEDPGFYDNNWTRKEFRDLQSVPLVSDIKEEKFTLKPHQQFGSRFLSWHTLNDSQLIIHSMGLGKSITAIAVIENIISNPLSGIKKAFVFVHSENLQPKFIQEILKFTGDKYKKGIDLEQKTPDQIRRAIKKNINKNYTFDTFIKLANQVIPNEKSGKPALSEQSIINEYDNSVIVVDEVHNLRSQKNKEENTRTYNSFFKVLHLLRNCKIILMTGTPMRDRPDEIADLINLILPLNNQIPRDKQFNEQFITGTQIINHNNLLEYFKGKVSTLLIPPSDVQIQFMGQKIGDLQVFNVYPVQMGLIQWEGYISAFNKDKGGSDEKKKEGFYSNADQASSFVFPDKSWGKDGMTTYFQPVIKQRRALKGQGTYSFPTIKQELLIDMGFTRDMTEEQLLNQIAIYSGKYAETIKLILNTRGQGLTYIYNVYVNGSGTFVLARLLELFGYERSIRGESHGPKTRYVIISNETTDNKGSIMDSIMRATNHQDNVLGDKIQVIIGGKMTAEGIEFHNVKNIIIHTPYWNYSSIDQAMFRCIRYGSHRYISQQIPNFILNVYFMVSTPPDISFLQNSIDYKKYKSSEDKDVLIRQIMRLLKISSVDCMNNRLVNMAGTDGSRACDYTTCNYTCYGITNENPQQLIKDTYNLFYSDQEVEEIKITISNHFGTESKMSYEQIKEVLNTDKSTTDDFVIITALNELITKNIPILNKDNISCFLREYSDIYYLTNNFESDAYSSNYYVDHLQLGKTFQIDHIKTAYLEDILTNEAKYDDNSLFKKLNKLDNDILQYMVKSSIVKYASGQTNHSFTNRILNLYKDQITIIPTDPSPTYVYKGISPYLCYAHGFNNNQWAICPNEYLSYIQVQKVEEKQNKIQKYITENKYGIMGIYNKTLGKFWVNIITDELKNRINPNDQRISIKGVECGTGNAPMKTMKEIFQRLFGYSSSQTNLLAQYLNKPNAKDSKADICEAIRLKLTELDLVEETNKENMRTPLEIFKN